MIAELLGVPISDHEWFQQKSVEVAQFDPSEVDGERPTDVETIGFAFLLPVAGNGTTTNLIRNGAVNFDRYPEQRRKLVLDPSLVPSAVEECLRFDSPVEGLARTLTRDVRLHGSVISKGDQVLLLFASAIGMSPEAPRTCEGST